MGLGLESLGDIYTGGYARTRALARADDPRALEAVARQFEAYFVQQMLASMRDASFGDPLFDSNTSALYRDMLDHQLSLRLAEGRGIGFARLLTTGFGEVAAQPESGPAGDAAPREVPPRLDAASLGWEWRTRAFAARSPSGASIPLAARPAMPPVRREPEEAAAGGFSTPGQFTAALRPLAERAARELGVSPDLLLAQSALETGWGKHVIARPDGRSSFNLFGIKADDRWEGPRTNKLTLEYDGAIAKRVRAPFRAYESMAESFSDYVEFIQGNARYRDALTSAPDPGGYLRGLQSAGYATDPRYAEKVLDILGRAPLSDAPVSTGERIARATPRRE